VSDLGCRFGGDEFAVVLVDTDRAGALTVAEAIRTSVERIGMAHGRSPAGIVTVSLGVATRTDDHYATVSDLISACDQALYRVKERGRNRAQAAVETAV
jgi:diguanylate cyclase (GGDEF)-like protein